MSKYSEAILDIVQKENLHPTAEEIFFQLRKKYPGVVLATVYNNLKKLQEEGLIRRISYESGSDRYDDSKPHNHLLCKRCGEITDIRYETVLSPIDNMAAEVGRLEGLEVLGYDLKLYYICSKCSQKEL